jgi:hypothetical protein
MMTENNLPELLLQHSPDSDKAMLRMNSQVSRRFGEPPRKLEGAG